MHTSTSEARQVTETCGANDQLAYFTSSSLTRDDRFLVFLSDRTGHPNIYCRNLADGTERQLTDNRDGTLLSYVYFNGTPGKGLSKASVSVDAERERVYFVQGRDIRCVDLAGNVRVLNRLPDDQVTAFTHASADGRRLCVPTTDARALEADTFVDDSPGYTLEQERKNEVIKDKPDYDIDERVQTEGLGSYLRIYDTETGEELACERVPLAWITHVQFSPVDAGLILYNHEWPADCGVRRLWLWDGKRHIRLRLEGDGRSRHDWVSHEMWEPDGQNIIYHGKTRSGIAFVGRVGLAGGNNVEIALPEAYTRYGHFTVGDRAAAGWLVSDGYYHPDGAPENGNWGGEWIALLKPRWDSHQLDWLPLCEHHSWWDCQDSHPHPIFSQRGDAVYFTSNRSGKRAVYRVAVPQLDGR